MDMFLNLQTNLSELILDVKRIVFSPRLETHQIWKDFELSNKTVKDIRGKGRKIHTLEKNGQSDQSASSDIRLLDISDYAYELLNNLYYRYRFGVGL